MTIRMTEKLTLHLDVHFRAARLDDLPKLEWFGQYAHYRRLFRRTFDEQQRGVRLMLLAEVGGFPVGQVFIHFSNRECRRGQSGARGYLYALRVLDPFQGQGIGSRLIAEAEQVLRARGYRRAVIAAAKDNERARRLYERLGYAVYAEDDGDWDFVDDQGQVQHVHEPAWMMQKQL